MAPDEAADVLAELEEETSEEILEEMEDEPKEEVRELLEFEEDSAGGMMNTEYRRAARDRHRRRRHRRPFEENEDLLETLNTLFLVDSRGAADRGGAAGTLFLHGCALRRRLKSLVTDDLIKARDTEHRTVSPSCSTSTTCWRCRSWTMEAGWPA